MPGISPARGRGFIPDRSEQWQASALFGWRRFRRRRVRRCRSRPVRHRWSGRSPVAPPVHDRSGGIERVAEDEAEAEREHAGVILEVLDESVDADFVRPLADVTAAETMMRLMENHDPEDRNRQRNERPEE